MVNKTNLTALALATATLTIAVGWWTAVSADASGVAARFILVTAAILATAAAIVAAAAARAERFGVMAIALVVVGVASPTSFAYVANLVVIALAAIIGVTTVVSHRRDRSRSAMR
jgi:hypothetical protein